MSNIFIDQPLKGFVWESNRIEGIMRDPTQKEIVAHENLLARKQISISDLETFVSIIQPGARLRRQIGQDVRIGSYIPPRGGPEIEEQLYELLKEVNLRRNSYSVHLKYETLHPFMDGNGRSGRALWLWQVGGKAPLGFLHSFYYQTLDALQSRQIKKAFVGYSDWSIEDSKNAYSTIEGLRGEIEKLREEVVRLTK